MRLKMPITRKRWLLLLCCLLFSYCSFSQRTVNGKVTDQEGEPLIGATVMIKGTATGVTTNAEGTYSIPVNGPDDVLIFSYVGFDIQEITVGTQTNINVKLGEAVQLLDELVVIGYGSVKKSDLTGSVAVITADNLTRTPTSTFDKALQGKAAGVMVTQTTGKPGESISIRVRGIGSINRNPDPIYVVDGVVTASLNTINPYDIESMQILKDASAAAIYGADGANGVVIITTKRGTSGKTKVSFSSYISSNRKPKKLDIMNADEYADFYNAVNEAAGITQVAYSDAFRQAYYGEGWEEGTDWQDEIIQKAYTQNYYLNVSGGSETNNYSISGNYYNEDGVLRNTGAVRYNLRANSDFKIGKYIKLGESINITRMQYKDIGSWGSYWQGATIASPLMKVYNPLNKGGYAGPEETFIFEGEPYQNTGGNDKPNPRAELEIPDYRRYNNNVLATLYLEIKPLKWLTYKITPSVELGNGRTKNWLPSYDLGFRSNNRASLSEEYSEYLGYFIENQLTLSKTFNEHTITATGVYNVRGSNSYLLGATGYGFDYENLMVISQSDEADRVATGSEGQFRMLSYLGRIIYDYKGRYLVTGSIRRDGVSRFGEVNRFGTFPSFSVAWKLNEDFLKEVDLINLLKVRFGWGQTGNSQIGDFQYDDFLTGTDNFAPVFGYPQRLVPGTYVFYSFANPKIKWEAASMTNFGFDLNIFNNRLQVSAEYYVKNQDDLLVQYEVPIIFGRSGDGSNPWVNAGKVQNRGFEIDLAWRKMEGAFNYSVNGTLTTIKNEVKYLPQAEILGDNTQTIVGHSIGSLYGYVAERIITEEDFDGAGKYKYAQPSEGAPQPGDLKFKDLNQDGVVSDLDRTIIGKSIPDMIIGLSFDCSYKSFDFSLFLYSMLNCEVFNEQRAGLSSFSSQDLNHNKLKDYALNYYREDRPSTEYVRADLNNMNKNDRISTWWVEDASFLRLRDIQLGYSLPVKPSHAIGISRGRIYVSAVNLLTLTGYSGRDPESALAANRNTTSGTSDPLRTGTDFGTYPTPRAFTLGIQVDF
jgi:TonB-dependent starch-binding outer membrane protein SusC